MSAQLVVALIACLAGGVQAEIAVLIDSELSLYKRVVTGVSIEVDNLFESSLNGDPKSAASIVKIIAKREPTAIVAIGPKAASAAIKYQKTIPVVYCLVPNLENYDFTRANSVGIRLEYPYERQLGMLKTLLPTVKRIGVLSHPQKSKAEMLRAKAAARRLGFVIVDVNLIHPDGASKALARLRHRVDAVWMMSDPVALHVKVVDQLRAFAIEQKLPFLALDDGFVAQGALMSFATDYLWVGRQAGRLANQMTTRPLKFDHVVEPEGLSIAINMGTAKQISVIPDFAVNVLNYAASHEFKVEVFQ